jgi:hypothetical protein
VIGIFAPAQLSNIYKRILSLPLGPTKWRQLDIVRIEVTNPVARVTTNTVTWVTWDTTNTVTCILDLCHVSNRLS